MDITVSIIVPIYNRESVLKRCINSIIAQDYHELEIILVNDGSTDRSRDICLDYSKNDDRVIFIDQANAGVSMARNAGINKASGRYLMFVDSDDYLETNAVSRMVSVAEKYDSDWIIGCVEKHIDDRTDAFVLREVNSSEKKEIQNTIQELEKVYSFYQPVAKLYRTSIIKNNGLGFRMDLSRGEDFEFNCRYGELIQSISTLNYVVYHYILGGAGSLSQSFYKDAYLQDQIMFKSLRRLHSSNIEIANQIQMELMWSSLSAISSKRCDLSFCEKVSYVRNYQSIPSFREVVNSDNNHFHWLKKRIMRLKNPFIMAGLILVCAKKEDRIEVDCGEAKSEKYFDEFDT